MKKITADAPESRSADLIAQNLERLRELLPEAFTEDGIDFQVLRELLGDEVAEGEERYGLSWHGKAQARRLALTPSTGTLRPAKDESVDWDSTQNLIIEGDNLEVLKLLQKSYAGKVKLIYIDPPYNTGNDFVYADDFRDNIQNYLEKTGQVDGDGGKVSTNSEASGRFHTDWLNMMYPRLVLARQLLTDDGLLFISIDDGEVHHLRALVDAVFGQEGLLGQLIWKSRASEDTRAKTGLSSDHEYLVCIRKDSEAVLRGTEKDRSKFQNPDADPRGPWRSADLTGLAPKDRRPNLHYDLFDPETGINYGCPPMGWRFSPDTMAQKISEGRVLWPSAVDGRPRHKLFVDEMSSQFKNTSSVILDFTTSQGTRELADLFEGRVFDFPKPTGLLKFVISQATLGEGCELVLDFFAGSGTTAHAVMAQNAEDKGNRRFILVQLPEATGRTDYPTIADITKERVRRAAARLRDENPLIARTQDLGFRVFKLDSTNLKPWDAQPTDLQQQLTDHVDHIKAGRTEQDLLYEVLLKLGLDLAVPMETRTIEGFEVHNIGAGQLMACFGQPISLAQTAPLARGLIAWHAESRPESAASGTSTATLLFRDSAFADDVAKQNLVATLEQAGLRNVRSV